MMKFSKNLVREQCPSGNRSKGLAYALSVARLMGMPHNHGGKWQRISEDKLRYWITGLAESGKISAQLKYAAQNAVAKAVKIVNDERQKNGYFQQDA